MVEKRKKYHDLILATQKGMRRRDHPKALAFLSKIKLEEDKKFYLRRIKAYSEPIVEKKPFPMVEVEFLDSWEHSGALAWNRTLWHQVFGLRETEARNMMKHKKVGPRHWRALQRVVERAEKMRRDRA